MQFLILDFETYWDKDYTLRKLTTEAYLRDPRFEVHGAALRWPMATGGASAADAHFYQHKDLLSFLSPNVIDWNNIALICHHAQFDAGILAFHYGVKPRLIIDTLSMARALVGNHIKVGLENLAGHFGLPAKNVPYELFKGRHWHELDQSTRTAIANGCCHDVDLTWDIFCRLAPDFPKDEYLLVNATMRMFTEPVLVGETAKLIAIQEQEQRERQRLLTQLQAQGEHIRSDETFAELLRAEGVEPATKVTQKGNIKYAFAKTDQFMRDLLEDEEPRLALLAECRLGERSTITATRASRLHQMSTRGAMCVYLAPYGAHTTRWSGGDKLNWQNFPRDSGLGACIEAPPGYKNVICDASQIECRLLNHLAGQSDVIERFRNKEDIYVTQASRFYGFPVTREHPAERGLGKLMELSCGYGAGAATIKATAAKGTYGPPLQIKDEEALRARDLYRDSHPAVVALWQTANVVLKYLANGNELNWLVFEIRDKRLYLPNGLFLNYESLHWHDSEERGWRLETRKGTVHMYGAKLVENFIQALSRVHIAGAWLELMKLEHPPKIVSMEHDKLIACVPQVRAESILHCMQTAMARPPAWAPTIPLDSEGYVSRTFKREIR